MIACIIEDVLVNVSHHVIRELREYLHQGRPSLIFPPLITTLCKKVGVSRHHADNWVDPDEVFHPLKITGEGSAVHRKKRKIKVTVENADADDDGEDPHSQLEDPFCSINTQLQTIWELVNRLPRPPTEAGPSEAPAGQFTREEIKQYLEA